MIYNESEIIWNIAKDASFFLCDTCSNIPAGVKNKVFWLS